MKPRPSYMLVCRLIEGFIQSGKVTEKTTKTTVALAIKLAQEIETQLDDTYEPRR